MQEREIHITAGTVLKVVAVLIGVFLLWLVRDIVALVVVALFLAALIQPAADWGVRFKIPRALMVIFVYLIFLGVFALVITLLVPTMIEETAKLASLLGQQWGAIQSGVDWLHRITDQYGLMPNIKTGLASVQTQAMDAATRLFEVLGDIFGGIAAFVIVLVMAFYLVTQEDKAITLVQDWVAPKHRRFALNLINELQHKMGRWFRGQIILSVMVGTLYYLGLLAIGAESALVLALFGGLLEFVPYLGPLLSGIPIACVAFSQSPLQGVLALLLIFLVHEFENNILVPKVMQKTVGLNPLICIVAMLAGLQLFGILGGLLAIPLATALTLIVKEIRAYNATQN